MSSHPASYAAALRFVPATAMEPSVVSFEGLPIETPDHRRLGQVSGVVVDLLSRRLRYIVVESARWAGRVRRLVPFSMATIDAERRTLRLEADTPDQWAEFDPAAFRPLNGDEVLVAVR